MDEKLQKDVDSIARLDAVQRILEVICRTTGMGFSAVARVTQTHWVACAVRDEIAFGLAPGGQLPLETTICDSIRDSNKPVVIDNVSTDTIYCDHQTPKRYGFQSYISYPINLPSGQFFGTLCAIDPKPAKLNNPAILGMFRLFSDLIALQLDNHDRMIASEAALLDERETAQLREQFIAVLGHDLRNPLGAIKSGVQVLRLSLQDPEDLEMLDIIQRSSVRMADLINNLMDFAQGRLGGGLSLARRPEPHLESVLRQVVSELQTQWPSRAIHQDIRITQTVTCEPSRIAQLLSNLVGNAITHGDPASPIWMHADTDNTQLQLSVANQGRTLPPEMIDRLFLPFARGEHRPGQQGLGLGLYIANQIAHAHHGTLTVTSTNGKTTFTLRMPLNS